MFDAAWRRGYWPHGEPARFAPEGIELALGGLARGAQLRSPEEVRRAVPALLKIDVAKLPLEGGAWQDGLDPDGELDSLLRASLKDMIDFFAQAAARG